VTDEDLTRSQELQIEANNRLIEELAGKNKKLDDSRKRFQDLVDQLPCVVLRFDKQGQIQYANQTWTSFLGGDPASVLGMYLEDMVHEEDRNHLNRSLQKNSTVELRFRQESGDFRWMRFSWQQVQKSVYQGLLVDLMETRELEDLLRRSQKMEAIGRLSGGVAHNFNNLLTVIMAAGERLGRQFPESESGPGQEVERIQFAAQEAARVTTQLLAFSRQQVLSPAHWIVQDILKDVEVLLGDLIKTQGIQLLIDPSKADELSVFVDKSQINQVLMNLVLNARDAIEGNGTIKISVDNTKVSVQEAADHDLDPGEFVILRVQDDGMGMSPQILEKIFEPFFTTKELDMGIGFGLATSYGIMQQSGGFIRVSSKIGVGSTFEVLAPISHVLEDAPKGASSADQVAKKHARILVVDDEEMILELTCEALREEGHQVVGVLSTDEAIAELDGDSSAVDLLITDVVMPDGGGRRLVDHVLEKAPHPQIIVVSGYDRDFLGDDLAYGTFMQKPYSLSDLLDQVQRSLSRIS